MDAALLYPEALALGAPLLLAWWAFGRRGAGRWWRLAAMVAVILAAAGPELAWERGGSDVILVVDRSASLGAGRAAQQELAQLVGAQRGAGDRLGVVVVGEGATVALPPAPEGVPRLADHPIGDGASDLAAGLEVAASLLAPGRTGRVLVHSDGELTGPGLRRVASQLAVRGVPVDALAVERLPSPDAAVASVELPGRLRRGESFIGAVTFVGEAPEVRGWSVVRLVRGGDGAERPIELARGEVVLGAGSPVTVRFADRAVAPGVARYEARLDAEGDRVPANNLARASLRVFGGEAALVIGGDGRPGNLSRALEAAGLEVVTRPEGEIALADLLAYRVLVLEQVPAGALGLESMAAVARYVEHFGGGLVMTGGRRSFGAGGYHNSPVEDVLPVTMELRDEHRKVALAMAITMDRSGSMSEAVDGGRTKMSLANAGAVAAVDLLAPFDEVAVHAVDSAPHVVVGLTPVESPGAITARIRGIRSAGGGIYVYEALKAAGLELLRSSKGSRHLVMFADAADAQEPGAYEELVEDFVEAGITVSVIGLGSESDVDAELLKDIAARGRGRVWFSSRAADLPRLFAQETLLVARSAWVGGPVTLRPEPLLATALGASEALEGTWPTVGGYNLTYPRDRAQVLATAPGDPSAPAIAVWRVGTGRSVVIPFDVDDPEAPAVAAWPGYAELLGGATRWAAGGDEAAPGALCARREGRTVTLTLELDPARRDAWPLMAPLLTLSQDGSFGDPELTPLSPVDDGVYEARVTLEGDRTLLPTVAIGAHAVHGPALTLPYSPEAAPRFDLPPGRQILADLVRDAGGALRQDVEGVFDNPPSEGRLASLAPLLVGLALLLLVAEVAVRRMRLSWPRRRRGAPRAKGPQDERRPARGAATEPARAPAAAPPAPADPGPGALAKDQGLHEALRELKRKRERRAR